MSSRDRVQNGVVRVLLLRKFRKIIIIATSAAVFFAGAPNNCERVYETGKIEHKDIIKLTVCADDCEYERKNMLLSFGHAFLVAENLTDEYVDIYGYELAPNDAVTFSWWAVDKHMGIWFNIESAYINLENRYRELSCVSIYIDREDLKVLNEHLKENDAYTPLSNCAKQVLRCWNSIADPNERLKEYSIMTPEKLINEIEKFDNAFALSIEYNENICYMHDGEPVRYVMES